MWKICIKNMELYGSILKKETTNNVFSYKTFSVNLSRVNLFIQTQLKCAYSSIMVQEIGNSTQPVAPLNYAIDDVTITIIFSTLQ